MTVKPSTLVDQVDLEHLSVYSSPNRRCDIVMKGGITSGVVYPLAVCELARTYRFKNIGGTSAGAVAAALTAAAEFGRDSEGGGFARVAALPRWLGEGSNLSSLFQPQRPTAPLYDIAAAATGNKRGRLLRIAVAAVRGFPTAAAAGSLPGLALAASASRTRHLHRVIGLASSALLALGGVVGSVSLAALLRAKRVIPDNLYGLCSGSQEAGEGVRGHSRPGSPTPSTSLPAGRDRTPR